MLSKKAIIAVTLALSAALGGAGFFGHKYFKENYLLLNSDEIAALEMAFVQAQYSAYALGKQACNKTI